MASLDSTPQGPSQTCSAPHCMQRRLSKCCLSLHIDSFTHPPTPHSPPRDKVMFGEVVVMDGFQLLVAECARLSG